MKRERERGGEREVERERCVMKMRKMQDWREEMRKMRTQQSFPKRKATMSQSLLASFVFFCSVCSTITHTHTHTHTRIMQGCRGCHHHHCHCHSHCRSHSHSTMAQGTGSTWKSRLRWLKKPHGPPCVLLLLLCAACVVVDCVGGRE